MRLSDQFPRVLSPLCLALVLMSSGCGGVGGGGGSAPTNPVGNEKVLNEKIKIIEAPPAAGETETSLGYENMKRITINMVALGGSSSKAAIPALEKFRDSTSNEALKKVADDAIAKIQK